MNGTRRTARNVADGYAAARDKRNGKPIITERPVGILERRHVYGWLAEQMDTASQDHTHVINRTDNRTGTVDMYYAFCGMDIATCTGKVSK